MEQRFANILNAGVAEIDEAPDIFAMQDIALLLNREGLILNASAGFLNLVKKDLSECRARSIFDFKDLFSMPDWSRIVDSCSQGKVAKQDLWINHGDSMCDAFHIVATPVDLIDGLPATYFVLAIKEALIEDEKRALVNSAYRDHLTGLFNRRFLEDHFDDFLSNCDAAQSNLAVLVVDVNDFKSINDTHGHSNGDHALRAIAQAIERASPLGDTVVRYGGDEFVVVLHDIGDVQQARDVAREIKFEVSRPFSFVDQISQVSVSIGVSLYPDHAKTFGGLIDAADSQMYHEKQNREVKSPAVDPVSDGAINWRSMVTTHFSAQSIVPFFQPIADLKTHRLRGAEVLSRMRKPDGTLAAPLDFIPVAENLKCIDMIDLTIFDVSCAQYAANADLLPPDFFFSVNLSAQTLAVPDLPILLNSALMRNEVSAKTFCLEVTESTMLLESGCGHDNLWALHEMGFDIALDDFGTGFSSMSLLKDLPVSKVKVDRSFVAGINRSNKDRALVESIVFIGKRLGLATICEGIEHADQAATLRDLGADFGQGFYWGRPAPIATLRAMMDQPSVSEA